MITRERVEKLRAEVRAQAERKRAKRVPRREFGPRAKVRVTEGELWDLYHEEQLSYGLIAERLGCSRAYVSKLMRKLAIPPRNRKAAHRVAVKHGRPPGHQSLLTDEERLERRREHGRRGAKLYRKRHPEKARAHWRVSKAVQRGTLERPDRCSACEKECVPQGHHEDYSKPLEVTWLCRRCHMEVHRREAAAVRGGDRYVDAERA